MDKLKCNSCYIVKDLSTINFKRGKTNKYGFRPVCKQCVVVEQKKYRSINNDTLRSKRAEHYRKIQSKVAKWAKKSKANQKKRRLEDPAYDAKIRHTSTSRHMFKYHNDPLYKLAHRIRGRINCAIKKNYKTLKSAEYLGCTLKYLKDYLESLFQPGMSWSNHGNHGWHIDHIIPLDAFDLSDPEQLKIGAHYTNLQPLWAKDNLKKSNKIS